MRILFYVPLFLCLLFWSCQLSEVHVNEFAPITFERVIEQQSLDLDLQISDALLSPEGNIVIIGQKASKIRSGAMAGFWLKMDQNGIVEKIVELATSTGSGVSDLRPFDIQAIDETNYAMCGSQITVDGTHFCFFKFDQDSEFGFVDPFYSFREGEGQANTLVPIADGGFIIGGHTTSEGFPTAFLTKLNATNEREWGHFFEDTYCIEAVQKDTAETYSILVRSLFEGEAFLTSGKNNENNPLTSINGPYGFRPLNLSQLNNGDYVVSRVETLFSQSLFSDITAYNKDIEAKWITKLENIQVHNIKRTNDGGIIAVGTDYPARFENEVSPTKANLTKLDALGNIEWTESYGGDLREEGHAVIPLEDGGYFLIGMEQSRSSRDEIPGSKGIYIIRTDKNGQIN